MDRTRLHFRALQLHAGQEQAGRTDPAADARPVVFHGVPDADTAADTVGLRIRYCYIMSKCGLSDCLSRLYAYLCNSLREKKIGSMRRIGSFCSVLVLAFACPPAAYCGGNGNAGSDPVEERVSKLEAIISKLPKMSGFINMRYENDGDASSLDVRRARLDFRGTACEKLDYRIQVEFANSPKILDAYASYKFMPEIAVQAGEFKIPFTLENQYSPTDLETVDNSMAVTYLCNYSDLSGVSANGRDVGICLKGNLFKHGDFDLADYSFGLFNGNGINVKDNNKAKDFSGTLALHPLRNLSVMGSYYRGKYETEKGDLKRQRGGVGVKWDDGTTLLRSEYICGDTGGTKSEGAYAVAARYVHPKVQAVLKYDYFARDKSVDDTQESDYLVGVNYFPFKCLRLQANYVYKAKKEGKDVNYVAVQFFARF